LKETESSTTTLNMSLRIEADEPTDKAVAKLLAIKNDKSITSIILAHQDFVLLNNKGKDENVILDAIQQVVVSTFADDRRRWQRLVFEYSYTAYSEKENRKYDNDNANFRRALSGLGRKLQQALDLDQDDMGLTGDSTRADIMRMSGETGTEHTGYGSIVFKKVRVVVLVRLDYHRCCLLLLACLLSVILLK
jgi:hypothetical protein